MIIPNYFEDLSISHINTLPRRNYFIPYADENEFSTGTTRRDSSYYYDLNGTWDFHYFDNIREIKKPFWLSTHKNELNYNPMTVPSSWQLSGYGQIQYTNSELPIPFDPPYAPYENPAGLYHRNFKVDNINNYDFHLNFEGVDAGFYVWVNDEFIGYSQISHSNTEFDLSSVIKSGINTLSVLVVQWGDMTYLEDQDKFRYSGIFRDVYLLKREKKRVNKFLITTDVSKDLSSAIIDFEIQDADGLEEYTYCLLDPLENKIDSGKNSIDKKLKITLDNPQLWNAENPNLYQLIISTGKEIYTQKIGLRTVYVEDSQILINHKPIHLIGVNHHDTHPETGATVTLENQRNDLELMKTFNFNAIRTAHYPKTAEFYELCDELGFYVMSEADAEAHGVVELYGLGGYGDRPKGGIGSNYNMIAEDPIYEDAFVDRMDASIVPFINFTSIFMWSAGNESGYGTSIEAALFHARELDSSRLLHYEGYWERDRNKQELYHPELHDVWSRMYTSFEEMDEIYFSEPLDKPFLLAEYIHAMGNGPGDIQDYHDYMEKHKEFVGGFVWEWADHAVNINRGTNFQPAYRYGGDFGEYPHFGNFCMDGLVYPDRTPHTGAYEHRQVFRPVVLRDYDLKANTITLKNRYTFSDLQNKVDTFMELYDSHGSLIERKKIQTPKIKPNSKATIFVKELEDMDNNILSIRLVYNMVGTDTELGFDTIKIKDFVPDVNLTDTDDLFVTETNTSFNIQLGSREIHLSKKTGAIAQLIDNKRALLKKPSFWTIWRAPIDNDRKVRRNWEEANYHHFNTRIHEYELKDTEDSIEISFKGVINAVARHTIIAFTATWNVNKTGKFSLNFEGHKNKEQPFLPRFGLCMPLLNDLNKVKYFGNGPYESYPDKQQANFLAQFNGSVDDFYEPYITPQENGSRNGMRQLRVFDDFSNIDIYNSNELSFNISHFSAQQLTEVKHRDNLVKEPYTYLHVDYLQSGSGSNACGPELLEKYKLNPEDFTFTFNFSF